MRYALVSVTISASLWAYFAWLRFISPRVRGAKQAQTLEYANLQELGVVGLLLPKSLHRAYVLFVLWALTAMLGTPHWLAIAEFWTTPDFDTWYFVHYIWTLLLWLALLAGPALVWARDRDYHSHQAPL